MSTDLADKAAEINLAIQDPVPTVGVAAPEAVTLMRGLPDPETGEWQNVATVTEMTGEDEEALDRLSTKTKDLSYADYTSALLLRAVTSIGTLQMKDDPSLIDNLIIGDRDLLFLGVIRATYGNIRTFWVLCPHCNEKNEVRVNLDEDFTMVEPTGDLTVLREVVLKDGTSVKIRYLTGKDAKEIAALGETPAVQNTSIIAHSVVWDDNRAMVVKEQWAKGLSLADRKVLVNTVLDDQPGPSLEEVNAQCAYCDDDITMVLDWVSLLFS
jgi:hypothetical protein